MRYQIRNIPTPFPLMRKSRQEAAETRQRIVEAASRRFREKGIEATALSDVMADAGLTHGGFYKHFASKDHVVLESLQLATDSMHASMSATLERWPGKRGINAAIEQYLSESHFHDIGCDCTFVSLASELARRSDDVRDAASAGMVSLIELFTNGLMTELTPAAARKRATVIVSTMIGAMTVARLVNDDTLAASVLREARKTLQQ